MKAGCWQVSYAVIPSRKYFLTYSENKSEKKAAELGSSVLGTGSHYLTYVLDFVQFKLMDLPCFMKQSIQSALCSGCGQHPAVHHQTPRRDPSGAGGLLCSEGAQDSSTCWGLGIPPLPRVSPPALWPSVPSHLEIRSLPEGTRL